MLRGIDHLVIACADPDAAALELERVLGLRAGGGGRHESLGTFNRLVWLGDSYLELIGVWDRTLAEASWIGAPTVRALDGGGGLATWALASDDLAGDATALRERGSELGSPTAGERVRPDGRVVRWRLAAGPRLGPEEPPFLIEHEAGGAEWTVGEREARAAEAHPIGGPVRLEALVLAVPDVARAAGRFLRALGVGPFRPSLAGRGARDAAVGVQTVRLRPGEGGAAAAAVPPVPAVTIELRVVGGGPNAARTADLLGCRWVIRPG